METNKKPVSNKQRKNNNQKAPQKPKIVNTPNDKFSRNIAEMKKLLTDEGFEVTQAENSKKINCKKRGEDGLTSLLLLIPMGVDRWITMTKVSDDSGKIIRSQQKYDFSFKATKDLVKMFA